MGNWLEQNKGLVFTALLIMTLFGGVMVYTRQPDPPPLVLTTPEPTATHTPLPPTPTAEPTITFTPAPFRVYVTGQVNDPDVYLLPPGSIIKDAITAAGGATEEADLAPVNLAQALLDQQQITIPAKADKLPTPGVVTGGAAPTPSPLSKTAQGAQAAPVINGKININTASLEELTTLNGIGPAIGQRIIDFRTEHGPFATIERLMDVNGIGPATFEKVREAVMVTGN
jgi:competence protein ComEA